MEMYFLMVKCSTRFLCLHIKCIDQKIGLVANRKVSNYAVEVCSLIYEMFSTSLVMEIKRPLPWSCKGCQKQLDARQIRQITHA